MDVSFINAKEFVDTLINWLSEGSNQACSVEKYSVKGYKCEFLQKLFNFDLGPPHQNHISLTYIGLMGIYLYINLFIRLDGTITALLDSESSDWSFVRIDHSPILNALFI